MKNGTGRRRSVGYFGVILTMAMTVAFAAPHSPAAGQAPVPILRLSLPQDDGSLTPYSFDSAYPYVNLIYDTLMWRDTAGVAQPWLAQSVSTSADGLTITIRLHDDARWQDGLPVSSDDVAFTFAYVAAHPHPRFTPQVSAVAGVTTPDPLTVVFSLRQPAPGFPDQPLADLPILPAHLWRSLPEGAVAPDGLPMGSGPYRLVEHRPGEGYRFEANTTYFRGIPSVLKIEVSIIDTADGAFSAAVRHTVDMIQYKLNLDDVQRISNLAMRVERGPSYLGTALTFNIRRPPFDRVEARRAVALALNLDRVALSVGDAVAADRGYIHPASRWAPPAPSPRSEDAPAAKIALAQLGLPTIEILAPESDPVKRESARQVALALQRAGQQAVAKPVPSDELAAAVSGDQPTFMTAIESIPPLASYDPDFLRHVFGSQTAGAQLNHSGYRSEQFDEVAGRIYSTPNPIERRDAVEDALDLLARDLPVVPLLFANGTFAYRTSAYNGWVFVKGTGILDKRSFVEPSRLRRPEAVLPVEQSGGGVRWTLVVLAIVAAAIGGLLAALVRGRH